MNNVDLTNPQWRVRKLKSFLFKVFRHEKAHPDDDLFQYFFFLQGKIESKLWELHNSDSEKFLQIFDKEILALLKTTEEEFLDDIEKYKWNIYVWKKEKSSKGINFSEFINSPLLQLYSNATGKSEDYGVDFINAVKNLAKYLFEIEVDFGKLHIPDIKMSLECINYNDRDISNYFTTLKIGNATVEVPCNQRGSTVLPLKGAELFNIDYINSSSKTPVFMVNSIAAAHKLQQRHSKYHRQSVLTRIKRFFDSQRKLLSQTPKTRLGSDESIKLLDNITKHLEILSVGGKWNEAYVRESNSFIKFMDDKQITSHSVSNLDHFIHDIDFRCKMAWGAFYGGINNLPDINLSPLEKRNVYWVLHQDAPRENILAKFINIYSIIHNKGLKDLLFIHVPEITNPLDSKESGISVFSPEELILEAFDYGIEAPVNLKDKFAEILAEKRKKRKHENYIVYPAIRKNSIILMTAKTGHGKSYLSMALSYAIATKGKLFGSWIVKEPVKVLYVIDREVDADELKKRKKIFESIYKLKKRSKSVNFYPVSNFNLLDEKDRHEVKKTLDNTLLDAHPCGEPVKLLVLDHLTKLTRNATTANLWSELRPWVDTLINELGISILLLHHENKSGTTFGTSFIENDVNAHIHIERHEVDNALIMDVTLPKNRNGAPLHNPYKVEIHMADGHPYITSDAEDIVGGRELWKKSTNGEKIAKFKELRNKSTIAEIADYYGMSKQTIEAFATKNNLTRGRWKSESP